MAVSIIFGLIIIFFNIFIRFWLMSRDIKELRRALADPQTLLHSHVQKALEALRALDETVPNLQVYHHSPQVLQSHRLVLPLSLSARVSFCGAHESLPSAALSPICSGYPMAS